MANLEKILLISPVRMVQLQLKEGNQKLDSETDFPGSPEFDQGGFGDWVSWLEKDLSMVDRSQTPWIVVVGHRPIYCTSKGFSDVFGYPTSHCAKLQEAVEKNLSSTQSRPLYHRPCSYL